MAMRWGPGPVFVFESLVAARRWGYYAARAGFAAALLVALTVTWVNFTRTPLVVGPTGQPVTPNTAALSRQDLARLGQHFFEAMAGVQLSLILLAAPAATAGAICLDRARGTLAHMMVTDLSDPEIVLGKLAARLLPVLALVATALPVLALVGLLGGVVPEAVVTLFLVTVGVAVLGCALALAVSVRVLKAHEVLMAVYAALAIWLMSPILWHGLSRSGYLPPLPDWYENLNPYVLAYAPYEAPGTTGWADLAVFLAVIAVCSAALVAWSILTLRRKVKAGVRRSERLERWASAAHARLFSWWPSPSLDRNPVLWREWHRNRPSRTARRVWTLYVIFSVTATTVSLYEMMKYGASGSSNVIGVNAFEVAFGLLFLAAAAPTALSEERVRGSLDVLMTTPLSTRSIVLAKWWAVFRIAPRLAILPGLGALVYAASATGHHPFVFRGMPPAVSITPLDRFGAAFFPVAWVLAHGAAIASVGVALATWFSQPGRAIAASVMLYLGVLIGSILSTELLLMPLLRTFTYPSYGNEVTNALEQAIISVSPFGGQICPLEVMGRPWFHRRGLYWFCSAALLDATVVFAAVLLGLTVATFNRCLGRGDEPGDLSFPRPPVPLRQLNAIMAPVKPRPLPGAEPAAAQPGR